MRISDWSSDVCSSDLPGFYDGVAETPEALKAQWRGLGLDDTAFLAEIGLSLPAGERGRDLLERIWARPTCDVNGIWGGYTGEGSKTVIPSKAAAKVSFRLVGSQDPARIRAVFQAFVRERLPADCRVEFWSRDGAPAIALQIGRAHV